MSELSADMVPVDSGHLSATAHGPTLQMHILNTQQGVNRYHRECNTR